MTLIAARKDARQRSTPAGRSMDATSISRKPRTTQPPRPTLRYGDRLGDYIITGFAGTGATSYVYRARPVDSFEPVAMMLGGSLGSSAAS